jgi:hypothetical protein
MRTLRSSSSDSHKLAYLPITAERGQTRSFALVPGALPAFDATRDDHNAIADLATVEIPHPPTTFK